MIASRFAKLKNMIALSTVGLVATLTAGQRAEATNFSQMPVQMRIATVDNPDNYLTEGFDGVARVFGPQFYTCGASLLGTGRHLLTAGHCLEGFETSDLFLDFGDDLVLSPSELILHPLYEVNFSTVANDIGIIELAEELPEEMTRYDIYRDSDEFGQIGDKVGYGGNLTGDGGIPEFDSQKRTGQNTYDAPAEILNGLIPGFTIPDGTQLAYDFDNGLADNDAFGVVFGPDYANLGLGVNEVNSVLGDSGGPTFIDGLIAGLTSFGFGGDLSEALLSTDVTPSFTDSSFGEISVDTRVSFYADWIDDVLEERTSVPEPSFLAGLIAIGAGIALKRGKGDRQSK